MERHLVMALHAHRVVQKGTHNVRRGLGFLACGIATLVMTAGSARASGAYNNLIQLDNSDSTHPAVATGSMVSHDSTNDPVENANLAYSHSFNCTGCRTVTVALQAVIIEANPTTIAPQNAAVAVNENCQSCLTFAYAHQYVFSPHHPVILDGESNSQLQMIQSYIDHEANSGEDFALLSSHLDNASWAFCYVVQRAVQRQDNQGGDHKSSTGSPTVCGAAPFDHRQVANRSGS
jgi:hypothetical protein